MPRHDAVPCFERLRRAGERMAKVDRLIAQSDQCMRATEEALVRLATVDDRLLRYLPPPPRA